MYIVSPARKGVHMPFINVSGKSDAGIRKWEYATAAGWMLERVLGKRLASNIVLNVKLVPKLKQIDDVKGDVCWEDDNTRPREFLIRIDSSQSKSMQMRTLAHELVHVKQFARGELFDYLLSDKTRWKGRKYVLKSKMLLRDYKKLPWEAEAYKYEKIIYEEWLKRGDRDD